MEVSKEYLQDEKKLFEYYLNSDLFPSPIAPKKYYINKNALELIIRSQCNLQCEYCYIKNYGDELYPEKLSKEETLKNFDLFLDYIYNIRKNYFYEIELYAGDLLYDEIILDLIEIIKKYFIQIKKDAPQLLQYTTNICIPSNLVNIYKNPELGNKLIEIFQDLRQEFNIRINFSWSTDGIYQTSVREKQELTEEYYNTIFEFCKQTNSGFHPMTSALSMSTAIENYDWWLKKIEELNLNPDRVSFQPMMLEVRNSDWTEETIDQYMSLLDHMMEKRLEMCNNSIKELTYHLFIGDGENNTLPNLENYDPLRYPLGKSASYSEQISCSAQNSIMLNCTNLSLCFCHRTCYPQFIPVYFTTDENKEHIIDYIINNIGGYITLKTFKKRNHPVCVKCVWRDQCLGGCLGSQFEFSGEILYPIPSVCKMFDTKFKHLLKLYSDYGVLKEALSLDQISEGVKDLLREKCSYAGIEV